jgi:hypothetical protein
MSGAMYAMQYPIKLPADYDMQIIRDRVTEFGSTLDGFAGLRFKAYLIRERDQSEPINEYAPFYVWNDLEGMRRFLWKGGGFTRVVSSFGRPAVHGWTVAEAIDGPASNRELRWATRQITALPEAAVPDKAVMSAVARARAKVIDTTGMSVVALDISTWSICEFALHTTRPGYPDATTFQVLHLSRGTNPTHSRELRSSR